jgi:hypothetical protein
MAGPPAVFTENGNGSRGKMRLIRGSYHNDTLANFRVAKLISMDIIKSEKITGVPYELDYCGLYKGGFHEKTP